MMTVPHDDGGIILWRPNGKDMIMVNSIAASYHVYIASSNHGTDEGIWLYRWDSATGILQFVRSIGNGVAKPIYLETDARHRFLYVADQVNEGDGEPGGAVASYAIDSETGDLKFLNRQPLDGGSPCFVDVVDSGRFVLAANYGQGTVVTLPTQADGRLDPVVSKHTHEGSSVNPKRQEGPHPHSIVLDPANRFAFSADLGVDRVMSYKFDGATGVLSPNEPAYVQTPAGSGPRHLRFHPNRRFAYVITELANTVIAYAYDENVGTLTEIQSISALPEGFDETSYCSDLHIHPDGSLLFGSNRGHDSIVTFTLDPVTGRLAAVDHASTQGNFPRGFMLDPSGQFLLAGNEKSDTVLTYRIDPATGKLDRIGPVIQVPNPVCFKFVRIAQ